MTPREKRMEMHERKLGIYKPREVESDTDDEDDRYGVMLRMETPILRQLRHLLSPKAWVRQIVITSLGAVHESSLLTVVNATLRFIAERTGKAAIRE